jgi:dimethylamine/trimethylamine dehydrogenase
MPRDPKHDVLFESVKIGPRKTRNRFWQTSHCAGPGSERPGAQAHLRGMKAEGGWGVVFTEFCSIHPETDEYPYTSARIWDEGDVRNLGYMCDVAHGHGSLAGIQLWYSGGNAPSLESREVGRSPGTLGCPPAGARVRQSASRVSPTVDSRTPAVGRPDGSRVG